jgi:autotransporter-associated beta strand protein
MNPLIQFKPTIPQRNRERQDSFAQLEVIIMKIMQSLLSWKSSFHGKNIQSPSRSLARDFLPSAAAILTLLLATASSSFAGSATWKASPANTDWNTAANWVANGPPNGPADTATFAISNIRRPVISQTTEVNGIVFNPGASAFTITSPFFSFTISGVGITNNSGITQNFVSGPTVINFLNNATAGSLTHFTNTGDITFGDSATAGNASFTNNAGLKFGATSTAGDATVTNNAEVLFSGSATAGNATFNNEFGIVIFLDANSIDPATAGNATFTNGGGTVSGTGGGFTVFQAGSTAGNATIITNGATVSDAFKGQNLFEGDAGNATLIANGGANGGAGGFIQYRLGSTGGTARVEVFGNGTLDISQHDLPGVTTGSIEGNGLVFLGGVNLIVGANNLSTIFSGLMQDGGISGGTGGSLTKAGRGRLSLTNANIYTGGTTITNGTLLVRNITGSATGTGAVRVNAGTLGGTGKITGAVTVGTGTSSGAILSPGNSATKPGTLTVNNTLTFNSLSTYQCVLNRTRAKASQATALGVTITSNVPFTFVDTGTGTLATGTVFTVINNTSANQIVGTFSNLSDGSVFTSNGNNFQVSYTGGDGNDLTLTVVP